MLSDDKRRDRMEEMAAEDVQFLAEREKSYGDSWKKRGGVGAFMNLGRKWDRVELQAEKYGWNVFEAMVHDQRPEGLGDDINDLIRYLMLIREEVDHRINHTSLSTDPSETPAVAVADMDVPAIP